MVATIRDGVPCGQGTEVVGGGVKMEIPLGTRGTIINMTLIEVE